MRKRDYEFELRLIDWNYTKCALERITKDLSDCLDARAQRAEIIPADNLWNTLEHKYSKNDSDWQRTAGPYRFCSGYWSTGTPSCSLTCCKLASACTIRITVPIPSLTTACVPRLRSSPVILAAFSLSDKVKRAQEDIPLCRREGWQIPPKLAGEENIGVPSRGGVSAGRQQLAQGNRGQVSRFRADRTGHARGLAHGAACTAGGSTVYADAGVFAWWAPLTSAYGILVDSALRAARNSASDESQEILAVTSTVARQRATDDARKMQELVEEDCAKEGKPVSSSKNAEERRRK
ncbi:hypothetical protein PG985_011170 [Apiospora marii]|uniref:uncharacterized protein n=1 Tax=Apiospora marii TaxID=335849 RepID=UPI00312E6436